MRLLLSFYTAVCPTTHILLDFSKWSLSLVYIVVIRVCNYISICVFSYLVYVSPARLHRAGAVSILSPAQSPEPNSYRSQNNFFFSSVQFLLKEFFNENNELNKLSLYVSILFLIINCVATQP